MWEAPIFAIKNAYFRVYHSLYRPPPPPTPLPCHFQQIAYLIISILVVMVSQKTVKVFTIFLQKQMPYVYDSHLSSVSFLPPPPPHKAPQITLC